MTNALEKTLRLFDGRLRTARAIVGTNGITMQDCLGIEACVSAVKRAQKTGIEESMKFWSELQKEAIEAKDEGTRKDALWALLALETAQGKQETGENHAKRG